MQTGNHHRDRSSRWLTRLGAGWPFAVYVAASCALFWPLLVHPGSQSLTGAQRDPALFIWWIGWLPFSLGHGLNPLYTHYWNAPYGVDTMWNTSALFVGLVMSPLTVLFNPLVAYNLASILGPAASAATAYIWLRRHTARPAAVVGGAVFGFSPFVVLHGAAHLHLTWLCLLPLILMLVEDLVWRAPRPAWRTGLYLGVVITFQWFTSTEVLLITAAAVTVGLVVLGVVHWRDVSHRWVDTAVGSAVAIAVSAVLCGPAIVNQFLVHPAYGPVQEKFYYQDRLRDLINAPSYLLLHTTASARAVGTSEDGIYVGLPLLALLLITLVVLGRRRRGVLVATAVAAVFTVLALGGSGPGGPHDKRFLPWSALGRISTLQNLLPARFAIPVWLAIAYLVAVALDQLPSRVPRWGRWPTAIVIIGCLVPLLPAREPVSAVPPTPRFFTSSQVDVIPQGSNVLIVPFPVTVYDSGFTWQAVAGYRFAQPAVLAVRAAGPSRRALIGPESSLLLSLFAIKGPNAWFRGPWTATLRASAMAEFKKLKLDAVVVGEGSSYASQARLVDQLLGRAPDLVEGGVSLWWLHPSGSR